MALTNTSLAAAFTANQLVLKATAATGATVGGFAKVDGEYMTITAISGTNISVSQRGAQGSAVVDHKILAPLTFGLLSDLSDFGATGIVQPVITEKDIVTVGADGVIAVPNRDTLFIIQKGSALASSTFANPSAAQTGVEVTFTSGTDFAHVITTVSVRDGTTGLSTVITFPAFTGASVTFVAVNGQWYVKSNNLVVIT
jgi:hypothetical protein